MEEAVAMLEAIDTSKGGGMIPPDQQQGCFCFRRHRGPWYDDIHDTRLIIINVLFILEVERFLLVY